MATPRKKPAARRPAAGMNRAAADAALAELDVDPTADPLAALVVTLADTLDNGAGSQTANVAREYRVALDRLRDLHPGADGFDVWLEHMKNPEVAARVQSA